VVESIDPKMSAVQTPDMHVGLEVGGSRYGLNNRCAVVLPRNDSDTHAVIEVEIYQDTYIYSFGVDVKHIWSGGPWIRVGKRIDAICATFVRRMENLESLRAFALCETVIFLK
jgi:hypothetical protein